MISAVVLAAGMSRRMGAPKLLLPWDGSTVIRHVVATIAAGGVQDILVVTGFQGGAVADALAGSPARCVFNPRYADGDMIGSIQAGLEALAGRECGGDRREAALLCLGDQPQIEASTVAAVLSAGAAAGWKRIVIPSFTGRAGHPILLPGVIWPEVLAARTHLRAVLLAHRDITDFLPVATPSILADLDTPDDYVRATGERSGPK